MNQNPVAQESKLIRIMKNGKSISITATQYKTDSGDTYWQYRDERNKKIIIERSEFGPNVLAKMIKNYPSPSYSQK